MRKPNKKQRHKIYKEVLAEFMTKHIFCPQFLCNELRKKTTKWDNYWEIDTFKFFPELFLFRPEHGRGVWFSYPDFDVLETSEVRTFVLQLMIQMTK